MSNSLFVMVWRCVGWYGVGRPAVCERSLDSIYYIENLNNNLKQSIEKIIGHQSHPFSFQEDNAPCHSAQKTIKYLPDEKNFLLPCQRPDINLVENLWK